MAPEVVFPHLGIAIQRLSKAAFSIGPIVIYWYGILIVLGVICGTIAACARAKRSGQDPGLYLDFLLYALVASIVCGRLYYVAFAWSEYRGDLLKIFALREGGLAIYGAVIGAFASAFIYTKVRKIDFLVFADTAIPGMIIGQAVGRWGNFTNREAFGGFTNSLFAMRYLANQVSGVPRAVLDNVITDRGAEYIQVHPTFLYESAWNLAVFLMLILFTRRKKVNGEITLMYLIGYGFGRFFIEGLRVDQLIIGNTGVPASQVVSAVLVVGGAAAFIWRRKRAVAAAAAAGEAGGAVELIDWGAGRNGAEDAREEPAVGKPASGEPTSEESVDENTDT